MEDIEENDLLKETRKVRGLETFSRQDIDGNFNSIATMQNNIERDGIDSEHDYQQKLNKDEYDLLNFLKEGISLWRSSEFMGQIVGRRKDVFRRTIYTEGHHDNVQPTVEFQQDTGLNDVEEEINSVATQWGLKVDRITGDGNCFFTAVAFQVSQMLSRSDLHASIRDHFHTI